MPNPYANADFLTEHDLNDLKTAGAAYLRDYAYGHGKSIYQWMKDYGIGESAYGKIMDAAAKGQGVFDHRHFGHHIIFDFPFGDLGNAPDFLEHLLISDFFTKQGISVVPGEFLKSAGILEFCSKKTLEWNFVNAFDLMAGTLAIYAGCKQLDTFRHGTKSIDSFIELAKQLGIGATELAVAVSTHNPFLLIGALMHLAGTAQGMMTSSSKAYFRRILGHYILVVAPAELSIDSIWSEYELSFKQSWSRYSLDHQWDQYSLKSQF